MAITGLLIDLTPVSIRGNSSCNDAKQNENGGNYDDFLQPARYVGTQYAAPACAVIKLNYYFVFFDYI
jgi:hypothetical protein